MNEMDEVKLKKYKYTQTNFLLINNFLMHILIVSSINYVLEIDQIKLYLEERLKQDISQLFSTWRSSMAITYATQNTKFHLIARCGIVVETLKKLYVSQQFLTGKLG